MWEPSIVVGMTVVDTKQVRYDFGLCYRVRIFLDSHSFDTMLSVGTVFHSMSTVLSLFLVLRVYSACMVLTIGLAFRR